MGKRKYFEMKASADGNSADIYLFGEIVSDGNQWSSSDTSATDFRDELTALGNVQAINLHINSPGGSVFEGLAIENMLKRNPATVNVYVDGVAASIASVIAMAGNKVVMPKNAMMMIHNAIGGVVGNAQDFRTYADTLDKVTASIRTAYLAKAPNLAEDKLIELMNGESWLNADEAVELGLADEIEDAKNYVASLQSRLFDVYKNVPSDLKERANHDKPVESKPVDSMKDEARIKQLKAKLALELAL